ncbi:hypothetical protein K488DRAFT_83076 [Vararia minispora EC-137]|uniref:Uncharacterized protein n=1 Tax=Vararia minispora EC-137 TaxID=1314806 RepID=A0ACB8QU62_9AGAM|nr:hypothetical protein K488DRAFT_83076 [Vararia minispora EC-137]
MVVVRVQGSPQNIAHIYGALPGIVEDPWKHISNTSAKSFVKSVLFSETELLRDLPRLLHDSTVRLRELLSSYQNTPTAVAAQRALVEKEAARAAPCFRLISLLAEMYAGDEPSSSVRHTVFQTAIYPVIGDVVQLLQHRGFLQPRGETYIILPPPTSRAACDCLTLLTWAVLLDYSLTISALNRARSTSEHDTRWLLDEQKHLVRLAAGLYGLLNSFTAVVLSPDLAMPTNSSLASILNVLKTQAAHRPGDSVVTLLGPSSNPAARNRNVQCARDALGDLYLVVSARLVLLRDIDRGDTLVYPSPDVLRAMENMNGAVRGTIYATDAYARTTLQILMRADEENSDLAGPYYKYADEIVTRYMRFCS